MPSTVVPLQSAVASCNIGTRCVVPFAADQLVIEPLSQTTHSRVGPAMVFAPQSLRGRIERVFCETLLPHRDPKCEPMSIDIPEFGGLSNADKLRIVTQLWDDIAASNGPVVVPPDILEEVSRRSAELKADPSMAIDDDELWRRVDG